MALAAEPDTLGRATSRVTTAAADHARHVPLRRPCDRGWTGESSSRTAQVSSTAPVGRGCLEGFLAGPLFQLLVKMIHNVPQSSFKIVRRRARPRLSRSFTAP